MDKRLSKYLQTVESELRGLPEQQREAELREMRGHLEAIVARLMEGGASEAEAVEAAIAQFGAARKLGRELQRASQTRETWQQIVLAPLIGMACGVAVSFVPLYEALSYVVLPEPLRLAWYFAAQWPAALSAGAVAGMISPRWGGRLMLLLLSVHFLNMKLLLLSIAEVNNSVLFLLLSSYSGVFLGSRYASRRAQRRING